jgi:hypothetical protein
MNPNGPPELGTLVGSLQGLRCWYVSCGGNVGSTFQLALGEKVPAHSEEYRAFEGEANLLVWCAWRLDGPGRPLASWDDGDAAVKDGLLKLVGTRVESVELTPPAWDLTVRFSGGLHLRIFCDHVPGDPSFDGNWELWLRHVAVLVGPGERCLIEPRKDTQVDTPAGV